MTYFIEFIADISTGQSLFSFEMECVPRVGEAVFYSFNPYDREKWNSGDLAVNDALSGQSYTVIGVEHFLQVRSLKGRQHRISCYIMPTQATWKASASGSSAAPPAAEPGDERSE